MKVADHVMVKPAAASRERRLRWTARMILYPLLLGLVALAWHEREAAGAHEPAPAIVPAPDSPRTHTFDGLAYFDTAVGDYVYVDDPVNRMELQVRLARIRRGASDIRGVATRIHGRRIVLDTSGRLTIDGVTRHIGDGWWLDLHGGAWVKRSGTTYTVAWPGARARPQIRMTGDDIEIWLGPHARPRGLLGNANGRWWDDLTTSSGRRLPAITSGAVMRRFTDSWRVPRPVAVRPSLSRGEPARHRRLAE